MRAAPVPAKAQRPSKVKATELESRTTATASFLRAIADSSGSRPLNSANLSSLKSTASDRPSSRTAILSSGAQQPGTVKAEHKFCTAAQNYQDIHVAIKRKLDPSELDMMQ